MITVETNKFFRNKDTYIYIFINNQYIASIWGKIVGVYPERHDKDKMFISISNGHFIHGVDKLIEKFDDEELND